MSDSKDTKPSGSLRADTAAPEVSHLEIPKTDDTIAQEQFEAGFGTKRGDIGRPNKFLNPLRGSF